MANKPINKSDKAKKAQDLINLIDERISKFHQNKRHPYTKPYIATVVGVNTDSTVNIKAQNSNTILYNFPNKVAVMLK